MLHSRDDPAVPFEEGHRIAAGIPGARLMTLDSPNHLILEGEPSWPRLCDDIRNFLND